MIETSYTDCLLWCPNGEFVAIGTSQKLIKLHHKVMRSRIPCFCKPCHMVFHSRRLFFHKRSHPIFFIYSRLPSFRSTRAKLDRLFATSAVTCFEREFGPHHPKYILWALTNGKTPIKSNQSTLCLYLLRL